MNSEHEIFSCQNICKKKITHWYLQELIQSKFLDAF